MKLQKDENSLHCYRYQQSNITLEFLLHLNLRDKIWEPLG